MSGTDDDGRKTPFFEDRPRPKEPEHVAADAFQSRSGGDMKKDGDRIRARAVFERMQEPKPEPKARTQAEPPEMAEKPRPEARKATYSHNRGMGMGPTIAGRFDAPAAEEFARPKPDPRQRAAEVNAAMAEPKPEPVQAVPTRQQPATIQRRAENGTWADVRAMRETSFPTVRRSDALRAEEAGLSADRRAKYEDRGRIERPADRLFGGVER